MSSSTIHSCRAKTATHTYVQRKLKLRLFRMNRQALGARWWSINRPWRWCTHASRSRQSPKVHTSHHWRPTWRRSCIHKHPSTTYDSVRFHPYTLCFIFDIKSSPRNIGGRIPGGGIKPRGGPPRGGYPPGIPPLWSPLGRGGKEPVGIGPRNHSPAIATQK